MNFKYIKIIYSRPPSASRTLRDISPMKVLPEAMTKQCLVRCKVRKYYDVNYLLSYDLFIIAFRMKILLFCMRDSISFRQVRINTTYYLSMYPQLSGSVCTALGRRAVLKTDLFYLFHYFKVDRQIRFSPNSDIPSSECVTKKNALWYDNAGRGHKSVLDMRYHNTEAIRYIIFLCY